MENVMEKNAVETMSVSPQEIKEERRIMEVATVGSIIEGMAGAGAIALAIIGLSGILPFDMVTISTILIGVGLLLGGGAIATVVRRIISEKEGDRIGALELGAGVTVETLGGAAGIALGVLSLLGIAPMTLVPIAAIVFGGVFILGIGLTTHLNDLRIERYCDTKEARHIARQAVRVSEGIQVLIGLDSIILGILSLIGFSPMILTLVAMLALGLTALTVASAVAGRLGTAFHCA